MEMEERFSQLQNQTAFFTGHRLLPDPISQSLPEKIDQALLAAYSKGYRRFICGGAIGFDTIAAQRTLLFRKLHQDTVLILVLPCMTQSSRWSVKDRELYYHIMNAADEKHVMYQEYHPGCMQARNRYMAEQSSLCICYLQHFHGGTAYTVRYALNRQIQVVNLAVQASHEKLLREPQWNYTYISPSANRNAVTVPLLHTPVKNLRFKHTLRSF